MSIHPRRNGSTPIKDFTLWCECTSNSCRLTVDLPLDEAQRLSKADLVTIVDGCERGPEASDELVEEHEGYNVYREATPPSMGQPGMN